ncbi:MAG: nucleotidyltransferase domain-containing protein [Promethearchaeota archaeon]
MNVHIKKIAHILEEIKKVLENLYKERLIDLILYGSYARGEERDDSDIDLAVILKGDIELFEEIRRIIDVTYDIGLKYNKFISIRPISENQYYIRNTPYIMNVKGEGISI